MTSSVFNEKPLEWEELDMSQNANPLIGNLTLEKLYMNFTLLGENDDARINDIGWMNEFHPVIQYNEKNNKQERK